jgi:hydroxyethylthiazole kinase-like uncharacterized protein yjeF
LGARFEFNANVAALDPSHPSTLAVQGEPAPRHFDALVMCAGLASASLLRPVGLKIPLAAVYGYSISAPIREPLNAPRSALMDERYKVAISRLGNRVRVAGSAEIGGQLGTKRAASVQTLYKVLHDWFPGAAQISNTSASVQEWKGARPMLPDGPPVIGAQWLAGPLAESWPWLQRLGIELWQRPHPGRPDCQAGARCGRGGVGPGAAGESMKALAHNGAMHRITPTQAWPLHDIAATRALEAAAQATRAPHVLMQRAGLAVAQLALAVGPHARRVWLACGPGNNGGDGLEAAMHLQQWGRTPVVTWLGDEATAPADALASLARAREAGVQFSGQAPSGLAPQDLCIDALLGIGSQRPAEGRMAACLDALCASAAPKLAVDIPTGLDPDSGTATMGAQLVRARWTLSLLTLKTGLFTAQGRDFAGEVWLDTLDVDDGAPPPCAALAGPTAALLRPHAHKGSFGDVAVLGGAPGMAGAALLAGQAALHGGAGRVFVGLLDRSPYAVDDLGSPS